MKAIFDAIRKKCPAGLWSTGVKLAREGAVVIESRTASQIDARVRAPLKPIPPSVTLYPDDQEWTCDCGGRVDPCEHVAAVVIAAQQADAAPASEAAPASATDAASASASAASASASAAASATTAPPRPSSPPTRASRAHVGYRLLRKDKSVYLHRSIVPDVGPEQPLAVGLATAISRGAAGALLPEHDDLTLDRLLQGNPRAFLPAVRIGDVFRLLGGARDVRLDGAPVRVSDVSIRPRAVVVDEGSAVVLRIERDPRVVEVVGRGVVRVAAAREGEPDVLHPIGEIELAGDLLDKLPRVRAFEPSRVAELVADVLPGIEARMEVEVRSKRLPKRARALKPRILLELGQPNVRGPEGLETSLTVVPFLVYGDPPQARVHDGQLVHLQGDVPVRDEVAEKKLLARLRDELNLIPGRRVDLRGRDASQFAQRLKAWAVSDPEQAVLAGRPLSPRIDQGPDGDRFDVVFEAARGDDGSPAKTASAAAVVRAWQEGLDLVPLNGGGWAPLPIDWLTKHGRRLADLLAAKDAQGELPKSAAPLVAKLCEALDQPAPPSFARLADTLASFERIPAAALPPDLDATLRPYQQRGVDWLCFLRDAELGAVLADDMGLGKTLQTIASLPKGGRALVVCPKSLVHNWGDEIAKFRPSLRVSRYHGPKRALDPRADVTITTYAVARLDVDTLEKLTWDALILDEAQAIKNPDSQAARAAYRLRARWRVALSGTPVENRLEELWSVFHFASPGLLGGRSDFLERFAKPISDGEPGAAERLRELTKPFLLRRLKKDVARDLPPRTDVTLTVELEERERAVYDAVRAATQKDLLERLAESGNVLAALEALLRLRQAACHPALVPGQQAETSSKVELLVEKLADAAADGHKALVFSQWTSMLDLIEPHLRDEEIPFVRLDGSTSDRAGVVARFQSPIEDGGPPVMLVSLKAGGTGLNLTAADHVFLVDPWWNPAVEDQAADRAHRIGQDKPVFVYRLVAENTVEEGILALQQRKRAIADAALADGGGAASITREELLALLGG
jgi:superfamily II DNA or RNA helicase